MTAARALYLLTYLHLSQSVTVRPLLRQITISCQNPKETNFRWAQPWLICISLGLIRFVPEAVVRIVLMYLVQSVSRSTTGEKKKKKMHSFLMCNRTKCKKGISYRDRYQFGNKPEMKLNTPLCLSWANNQTEIGKYRASKLMKVLMSCLEEVLTMIYDERLSFVSSFHL